MSVPPPITVGGSSGLLSTYKFLALVQLLVIPFEYIILNYIYLPDSDTVTLLVVNLPVGITSSLGFLLLLDT